MEHNFGFSPGKQKKKKEMLPGFSWGCLGLDSSEFFCLHVFCFISFAMAHTLPTMPLIIVSVNVCIVNVVSVCHALVVVIK